MLDAARDLFVQLGYQRASVEAVASRAGVSAQTIYSTFGAKVGLLRAVARDAALGVGRTTMVEPAWIRAVRSESDQRARWEIMREATAGVLGRVQPLAEVIRAAAVSDPAVLELWNEMEAERFRDVTTLIELLAETGPLRVPVAQAVDLIWAISRSTDLYQALACERSWSDESAFEAVSDAIAAAVLRPIAVTEHH